MLNSFVCFIFYFIFCHRASFFLHKYKCAVQFKDIYSRHCHKECYFFICPLLHDSLLLSGTIEILTESLTYWFTTLPVKFGFAEQPQSIHWKINTVNRNHHYSAYPKEGAVFVAICLLGICWFSMVWVGIILIILTKLRVFFAKPESKISLDSTLTEFIMLQGAHQIPP